MNLASSIRSACNQLDVLKATLLDVAAEIEKSLEFNAAKWAHDKSRTHTIIKAVCAYYGVEPAGVLSHSRSQPLVWARFAVVYQMRRVLPKTNQSDIARMLSPYMPQHAYSNHFVRHALRCANNRVETEPEYAAEMEKLSAEVDRELQ